MMKCLMLLATELEISGQNQRSKLVILKHDYLTFLYNLEIYAPTLGSIDRSQNWRITMIHLEFAVSKKHLK